MKDVGSVMWKFSKTRSKGQRRTCISGTGQCNEESTPSPSVKRTVIILLICADSYLVLCNSTKRVWEQVHKRTREGEVIASYVEVMDGNEERYCVINKR